MTKNVFLIALLFLCSCNFGFLFKYHIVKDYYLIASDSKYDLVVCKANEIGGSFSGKTPSSVIQFSCSDSLIAVLVEDHEKKALSYYILNMNKDTGRSEQIEYLEGPLSEQSFNGKWKNRGELRKVSDIDSRMGIE